MSEPINIPMEHERFPVDPPIVDTLYFNSGLDAYVITFIPADVASKQEKELVTIARDSGDGRRVRLRLEQIEKVIGGKIDKVFHRGDGDFGFALTDGKQKALSEDDGTNGKTQTIYVQLQDLGMIAQIAFHEGQLLKSQAE